MKILVAGASGVLGQEIVRELVGRGHTVRALTRAQGRLGPVAALVAETRVADVLAPKGADGVADGCDAVVSCLGASVQPSPGKGRRGFLAVDLPANTALLEAARAAGVKRFVYVSVFGAERFGHLAYYQGHERFVERLRASGLSYAVIRPTGFFSALEELLTFAARGRVPEMGTGSTRTNPIHDADLAAVIADALTGDNLERDVGGPEVLTRRALAELACAAVGRPPKVTRVPLFALKLGAFLVWPFLPRLSQILRFFATITTADMIAPATGTRTLGAYFEERARARKLLTR
jgi:uncharacterized protein YbjT (DUF2867 family)